MKHGGVDFRFPRRLSLCLSVPPSVCPSVHSMSVHSVFQTFLSHPLKYWLDIWYTTLSWYDTDQVWLLSRLTYFYLSYCPLQKCLFTRFSEVFSVILWDIDLKFGIRLCLDMIHRSSLTFVSVDVLLNWVIATVTTSIYIICKNWSS